MMFERIGNEYKRGKGNGSGIILIILLVILIIGFPLMHFKGFREAEGTFTKQKAIYSITIYTDSGLEFNNDTGYDVYLCTDSDIGWFTSTDSTIQKLIYRQPSNGNQIIIQIPLTYQVIIEPTGDNIAIHECHGSLFCPVCYPKI